MAKLVLVCGLVFLGFALTCSATTYTVGDTAGWDISSDLDAWTDGKKFYVGDVLWFQYSSSNSVNQVTKENFEACNTTKALNIYSGGNTTVTLSHPGGWYFVSGNKLYCLGGMKLAVQVDDNQDYAPAGAPQAATGSGQGADHPQPSSKTDLPTSSACIHGGPNWVLVLAILGLVASMLHMDVKI